MQILMMADTPPNPDSGAAGTEYQTMLALRRMGHQVDTVWAEDLPHRIQHGNLHYLLELPLGYRCVMLKRLQDKRYDVVHCNQPHGYLAARALGGIAHKPVFVHRSHGFEPRVRDVLRPWIKKFGQRRSWLKSGYSHCMTAALEINNIGIARFADGHIVSASLCADFLKIHYSVSPERIAVIPQAPPAIFQDTEAPVIDSLRLNRVLYVGQFALFKAPMILASAFDEIVEAQPLATLTWVCDARHHAEAAALLSPKARARTTLLPWVAQDKLIEIYDSHGIFLFPSFFEGFGKVFLEAMARGLVVVASAEGGARDVIESGQNGILVSPGDASAMASAVLNVQRDPFWAEKLSCQARASALTYTWDRVAQETTAFYERLIG